MGAGQVRQGPQTAVLRMSLLEPRNAEESYAFWFLVIVPLNEQLCLESVCKDVGETERTLHGWGNWT